MTARQLSITDVVNRSRLKLIWKDEIRKTLRSGTFRDFYIPQDALQFAAFEWELDSFLDRLIEEVLAGTYTPSPAVQIRGAKGIGLSRPLSFPVPRDALLYRALVQATVARLEGLTAASTGSTKKDRSKTQDSAASEYGDWFGVWMSKQGVIRQIVERCEFVVESDISNYFPSIDIRVVREHLLSHSDLDRDAVRLCTYILERIVRHPSYADAPSLGLAQEPFDASRAIGHSLLADVDREFVDEEKKGVYYRFMDDFAIGAQSRAGGERVASRLQRALEPLGLYPNTAKTRIVTRDEFLKSIMTEENDVLDCVEGLLDMAESGPPVRTIGAIPASLREMIEERAIGLASLDPGHRQRRWPQVMRRYVTALRRIGSEVLVDQLIGTMMTTPELARTILEYTRSFPLSRTRLQALFEVAEQSRRLYQDVTLLTLETLATMPNRHDRQLWVMASAEAISMSKQILSRPIEHGSFDDWTLTALATVVAKFGSTAQRQEFVDYVWRKSPKNSFARLQGLSVVLGDGMLTVADVDTNAPGLPWMVVLDIDFLRSLEAGDDRTVGICIGLLQPEVRLQPNRWHVHPRPAALAKVIARAAPKRVDRLLPNYICKLSTNPIRLRDRRLEALYGEASTILRRRL